MLFGKEEENKTIAGREANDPRVWIGDWKNLYYTKLR